MVINSREEVKKLAGATIEFIKGLIETKHPLTERYSFDGIIKGWEAGADYIFRGAPALVIAHSPKENGLATVDCTIALVYLDIAAAPLGLGTCWAGFFMIASSQSPFVQQLLALPESNVCSVDLYRISEIYLSCNSTTEGCKNNLAVIFLFV